MGIFRLKDQLLLDCLEEPGALLNLIYPQVISVIWLRKKPAKRLRNTYSPKWLMWRKKGFLTKLHRSNLATEITFLIFLVNFQDANLW